jgi:phospholipid/cholesterol/gamma-HCH transport system substrate-binding protein
METRANYTLVGAFVLLSLIAVIAFILWTAQIDFSKDTKEYDIYFSGTVTGLKEGSTVLYRGVPVGAVQSITLDPQNVEKIRITIAVKKSISIKKDAYASLEIQGITGIAYIQINGGTSAASNLEANKGETRPVIPAKSSVFEQVTASLPVILNDISHTLEELRSLLSTDVRSALTESVQNIRKITQAFVPDEGKKYDLADLLKTFQQGMKETRDAAKELKDFIKENRYNIHDFTAAGLPALTQFLTEGQETLTAIRRLSESLERSPTRFIYNDPKQGVRLP